MLDRDGVINNNDQTVHIHEPNQFVLFPKVCDAIRMLNNRNFLVLVATNQGGVGLGFLTEGQLDAIHDEMRRQLHAGGAHLDGIAACTHAPRAGCDCRKPKPGMLIDLQQRFGFNVEQSYMVGDRETDIEAGNRAGLQTIKIGHAVPTADHTATSLYAAVQWIVGQEP